ncbi:MAG: hypothetical protein K8F59_10225 [Rhodobacteraceae bacterium]|nr:hypothetical protein [Paracoccaceae bacterium]
MQTLVLKVRVPDERFAEFQDCILIAVPVSEQEAHELDSGVVALFEHTSLFRRTIATLKQILESDGDKEGRFRKTLEMLLEPSSGAVKIITACGNCWGGQSLSSQCRKGRSNEQPGPYHDHAFAR